MFRATALVLALLASAQSFAATPATVAADPAKGKVIAETVCVACHAADGNGLAATPNQPKLAGQGEEYIYKQLKNFKAEGNKPALRANPVMAGMTANLSDADMRNLAAWFTKQKQQPSAAKSIELAMRGQEIWRKGDLKKGLPACAGCHGPAGGGIPAQYPRLAGQFADYSAIQLKTFRQGERANDPARMMRDVAAKLSDDDIKAVAEYIAGLR